MRIHSSSLAFIPAGYNSKNRNEPSSSLDSQKAKNTEPNSLSSGSNTSQLDKKIDAPTLELISNNIEQQKKVLSNSRTAYAVNAYIQENTQTLKTQRSELISGIDLFA